MQYQKYGSPYDKEYIEYRIPIDDNRGYIGIHLLPDLIDDDSKRSKYYRLYIIRIKKYRKKEKSYYLQFINRKVSFYTNFKVDLDEKHSNLKLIKENYLENVKNLICIAEGL